MKIDRRNPGHWLLLSLQFLFSLIVIAIRPFRRQASPDRHLVVLYGHQLSGNLKALYEEWARSGDQSINLYYLSLDPQYGRTLKKQGINVLQCNRLCDMLQLTGASALVSDHGLHMMAPLLYLTNIVFIDVWHGIPFKGFVPDDFALQHRYDEIWVSSPDLKKLYIERFGFDPEKLTSPGYARIDRLLGDHTSAGDFRQRAAIPDDNKIVLYAPTWQQDDSGRELFPFNQPGVTFTEELAAVCRRHNATLVIRSHLNADIPDRPISNVVYCPQQTFPDTEEILLATDILICDWSSIAFDFLVLNRPTLFLDVAPPFSNGFSLGPQYRFGAIISDMSALTASLEQYLSDPSAYQREYQEKHAQTSAYIYGASIDGASARRQLDRLRMILKGNP